MQRLIKALEDKICKGGYYIRTAENEKRCIGCPCARKTKTENNKL